MKKIIQSPYQKFCELYFSERKNFVTCKEAFDEAKIKYEEQTGINSPYSEYRTFLRALKRDR